MDIPKENNDTSIQLSKKPMNEKALAGLAAGRAKLQELNKVKADAKTAMLRDAIAKKATKSAERDAKLLKEIDLAMAELSEGEEEVAQAPPMPPIAPPKAKPSRVVVVPKTKGHPSAPREERIADEPTEPVKKPKKKVIRYVEESSSEEEEIVYVKREKKQKAAAYKAPPQQQIMFW